MNPADHFRESLISGEFQWKSKDFKRTPIDDRSRRVYFLFTLVIGIPDRRRPSGMHFPNRNDFDSSDDCDQIGDCLGRCFNYVHMHALSVKIPDHRGPEKSPILMIHTTSD